MRCENKINIVKLFLILYLLFVITSFLTRDGNWISDFLLILSESALSVLIVLMIVERAIQRETT
jgi:hypothetical protein